MVDVRDGVEGDEAGDAGERVEVGEGAGEAVGKVRETVGEAVSALSTPNDPAKTLPITRADNGLPSSAVESGRRSGMEQVYHVRVNLSEFAGHVLKLLDGREGEIKDELLEGLRGMASREEPYWIYGEVDYSRKYDLQHDGIRRDMRALANRLPRYFDEDGGLVNGDDLVAVLSVFERIFIYLRMLTRTDLSRSGARRLRRHLGLEGMPGHFSGCH